MGQGGYITVMNATPYEWELTGQGSTNMNSWDFPSSIVSGNSHRIYVEWEYMASKKDGGNANYTLCGTDLKFEVQARNTSGFNLRIDVVNIAKPTTPQPIPPQSSIIDLGWKHDGNVDFSLVGSESSLLDVVKVKSLPVSRLITEDEEKRLVMHIEENDLLVGENKQNYPTQIQGVANSLFNTENILLPLSSLSNSEDSGDSSNEVWLRRWMFTYKKNLKKLTIEEIALPGTHDSGTYDMKSHLSRPWTQTQNIDLKKQLQVGTRALDLRIGLQPSQQGDEKFILVHDTWRTNVTVSDALDQIVSFSNEENDEIILLDFHRFVELEEVSDDDYANLITLIHNKLSGRLIPPSKSNTKLGDIWEEKERIIVAWNRDGKSSDFWDGVDQHWFDQGNKSGLHTAIENDLKKQHKGLWSICAVLTPSTSQPIQVLSPDLSLWFSPSSEWSKKVNIVSCDFINKTRLAHSLIIANMIKSYSK